MLNVCVDRDGYRRATAVRIYTDATHRYGLAKWCWWESLRTKVFRVGEMVISGSGDLMSIKAFIWSVRRAGPSDFDQVIEAIERGRLPGRFLRLWLFWKMYTEIIVAGYSKKRRQLVAVTVSTRAWQPDEIMQYRLQPADGEDIDQWKAAGHALDREGQIGWFEARKDKLYPYGFGTIAGAAGYLEETVLVGSAPPETRIVRDWRAA